MLFYKMIIYFMIGFGVIYADEQQWQQRCDTDASYGFVSSYIRTWTWPAVVGKEAMLKITGVAMPQAAIERGCAVRFGGAA